MGTGLISTISDAATLERAAAIIRDGGVVAVPTETFYGLAADWRSESATARIFEIKGRPATMNLPLVAASDVPKLTGLRKLWGNLWHLLGAGTAREVH